MTKPKITEIYEDRILTRNERNEYGEWERVQKELRYKKPVDDISSGLRLVHLIIDFVFYYLVLWRLIMVAAFFNSNQIVDLIFTFSFPLYYIICEFFFQKTLGKVFTNSIVVNEYGEKPDFKTILIRTVIRFIPFESLSFLNSNRGWHDTWTNTYVIRRNNLDELLELTKNPENLRP